MRRSALLISLLLILALVAAACGEQPPATPEADVAATEAPPTAEPPAAEDAPTEVPPVAEPAAGEPTFTPEAAAPAETSATAAPLLDELANVLWQWTDLAEPGGAGEVAVPNPENYTVGFLFGGGLVMQADCNRVAGTYTLDGDALTITLGPSTMAFCGEESLDTQFLAILGAANSVSLENGRLVLSTAAGATMGFADGGPLPGSAGLRPSQISLDTQGLPYAWQANVVPMTPYDESQPPGPQGLPEHIQINFGVTDPALRQPGDPVMFIIPALAYEAMYMVNDNSSVVETVADIEALTYALPSPAPTAGLPALPAAPVSPVAGANDLAVQAGRAAASELSASKNGFRFVGRWQQSPNPVTNQGLFYVYQGFTNDGQFLVSFFYPVSTAQLPATAAEVPQEQMDALSSDMTAYMQGQAEALNALAPSDWEPDLATLDALVGSLQIAGMPSDGLQGRTWQWTSREVFGNPEEDIPNSASYTVTFAPGGELLFQADCNRGTGTYTIDPLSGSSGGLMTQLGAMTLAACAEESLSDDFIGGLSASQNFRVRPGGLSMGLILPAGGGTLTFYQEGYAPIDLAEPEAGQATATVSEPAGANVRTGPGTAFPVLGVAPLGASAPIIAATEDGAWYLVEVPAAPEGQAWVSASVVTVENADNLPIALPPELPPTPVPSPTVAPTATAAPQATATATATAVPQVRINFKADSTTIQQGECTTLRWDVENIQAVWVYPLGQDYRDFPATGQGSQEVCPEQTTAYEMRVLLTDGTVQIRTITITVELPASDPLAGTAWTATAINGQPPVAGTTPTLAFSTTGTVSAGAGCNTFGGGYTATTTAINIGPLFGTTIACDEALMDQDTTYLAALESAAQFLLNGNTLTLFNGAGQEVVRLSR